MIKRYNYEHRGRGDDFLKLASLVKKIYHVVQAFFSANK